MTTQIDYEASVSSKYETIARENEFTIQHSIGMGEWFV